MLSAPEKKDNIDMPHSLVHLFNTHSTTEKQDLCDPPLLGKT